ncbi:pre-mRNA-splicing factor syf2 [Tritrichomonas musculus]|uniref:Pre-mRNA-splicing factor SYF2 n=1 Tax=Tritrichomonas musculus TaxID=1915356 RepID=A0ABR2KKX6_9EUKA
MDKEEMLRRIQMRINQARSINNQAASEEIAKEHQIKKAEVVKDDLFKIPTYLLRRNGPSNAGPTSEDHLYDPDVSNYLREIRKIPKSVYQDYLDRKRRGEAASEGYRPRDEIINSYAERLISKQQKRQDRNKRAMNYDISGKYSVDFINDKNKRFNRKLAREYNSYTEDIRLNMERGGNV